MSAVRGGLVEPTAYGGGHRTPAQAVADTTTPADGMYRTMGGQPAGSGPGVTSSATVAEMGPADRLLAGTTWDREDVSLALQALSTALLLYWIMTEVA
jgi:hypothetical protein